jgi:hypothetical protein
VIKRLTKFFLGLLLIPAAVAVTLTLVDLFLKLPAGRGGIPTAFWWFAGGFAFWMILWFVLPRPARSYVLAHELTHALCGWFFGARWSKLRVTAEGGSVNLTKTNVWITLAPYFFPFYTMIAVIVQITLRIFVPDTAHYEPFWLAMIGLTWAFHVTFTLSVLMNRQPDVQEHGRIFSWTLIYLLNLLGISIWILLITRGDFLPWLRALASHLAASYIGFARGISRLIPI